MPRSILLALSVYFLSVFFVFAQIPSVGNLDKEKTKPGIPAPAVPIDFFKTFNLFNTDIKKIIQITVPTLKFRESAKRPAIGKKEEPPLDQLIEKLANSRQPIAILLFRNPFSLLFSSRGENKSYVLISRIPSELVKYFSGMRIACPSKSGREDMSIYFGVEIVNQLPVSFPKEVDDQKCYATYNFFDSRDQNKGRGGKSLLVPLILPKSLFTQ